MRVAEGRTALSLTKGLASAARQTQEGIRSLVGGRCLLRLGKTAVSLPALDLVTPSPRLLREGHLPQPQYSASYSVLPEHVL